MLIFFYVTNRIYQSYFYILKTGVRIRRKGHDDEILKVCLPEVYRRKKEENNRNIGIDNEGNLKIAHTLRKTHTKKSG